MVKKKPKIKSSDLILTLNDQILCRQNNDKTMSLILLENDEVFFKIEGRACDFFKLIDGKKKVSEIIKKYKRTPPTASEEKEIKIFVAALIKERIVIAK